MAQYCYLGVWVIWQMTEEKLLGFPRQVNWPSPGRTESFPPGCFPVLAGSQKWSGPRGGGESSCLPDSSPAQPPLESKREMNLMFWFQAQGSWLPRGEGYQHSESRGAAAAWEPHGAAKRLPSKDPSSLRNKKAETMGEGDTEHVGKRPLKGASSAEALAQRCSGGSWVFL